MRLVFSKRFLRHQPVIDNIVLQVQIKLVKQQGLNVAGWPLRLFLNLLLVVIEHFEDLRLELGGLNLGLIVVLIHEHITVPGYEDVDHLLIAL